MKNYLALDTCGPHMTVVLYINGEYYTYFTAACAMKHGSEFMTAIEDLLIKANCTLKDLDFFGCVIGAGSFTGIRIGVSAIKALCQGNGKPFVKVTEFDCLAYNFCSGKRVAVIDAKHGSYYTARYIDGKLLLDEEFIGEKELDAIIEDGFKPVSSTPINKGEDSGNLTEGLIKAVESVYEKDGASFNLDDLSPLYLRKSQAEEGR